MIMAAKRSDHNQALIVEALRAAGASVTILSSVGGGCPDLLCGFHERNVLIEVKNLDGRGDRLTPAEDAWIRSWRGQVAIVYDPDEALQVLYGSIEE
jgi:hypothetical protein